MGRFYLQMPEQDSQYYEFTLQQERQMGLNRNCAVDRQQTPQPIYLLERNFDFM